MDLYVKVSHLFKIRFIVVIFENWGHLIILLEGQKPNISWKNMVVNVNCKYVENVVSIL